MDNKSVNIGQNFGSPIVTGTVRGNVDNRVEHSFNTYTEQQKQSLAEAAAEIQYHRNSFLLLQMD